jgi:hypothetical protein
LSSSQVKIRNVHIYKFTAGIVVKPNADNNGDFVQIEKAIIERVAYGISIGNSQARNTRISDSYIDAHTCITNSKHGAQIGRISVIENVHFGGYQWLDLGAPAYLEGLEINDCYGESFQWIGSIGVGTVGAFPAITFNGCKFQASAIINRLLTPTANLTGDAVYNFNHCSFQGNRLYVFENDQAALINFNQCNFGIISRTWRAWRYGADIPHTIFQGVRFYCRNITRQYSTPIVPFSRNIQYCRRWIIPGNEGG